MIDLGYLNARIRAWTAELLSREEYDELIGTSDLRSLLNHLRETAYARDMEIAGARYSDEAEIVEGGLKANLSRMFMALWEHTPPEARLQIGAIFYVWEVYNLKAILRARDKGISPDDSISVLMPAGSMDESALKELNQQKGVEDIIGLLSTWGSPYARVLKDVLQEYLREKQLVVMELAMDRLAYERILSIAGRGSGINRKIFEQFARYRVDSANVSTLLKFSGEGIVPVNAVAYFIQGGERLDRASFFRLLERRDIVELLRGLTEAVKDKEWRKAIRSEDYEEAFFLEERLEEILCHGMCKLAIVEPLSIALAICYIYQKMREVKNLRLIARAKIFKIPAMEAKRFIL